MNKAGIKAAIFGLAMNFILFLIKLYVGISTGFHAIYCDGINNLGDTAGCIIAVIGFALALKLDGRRSGRVEALSGFVINLVLFFAGAYFIYSGIYRITYPVKSSYSMLYAVMLFATVIIKLVMALVYYRVNKAGQTVLAKALITDSISDAAITAAILIGFTFSVKINFAIDAFLTIICGGVVVISSARQIKIQSKFLIND